MNRILINSLPKAGTNLVAKILDELGYKEHLFLGSNMVLSKGIAAGVKTLLNVHFRQGYLVGIDSPVSLSKRLVNYRINGAPETNTYITSHVGYSTVLLNDFINLNYRPILVIRDPRDVLNSFMHYVTSNKKHPLYDFFKNRPYDFLFRKSLFGFNDDISLEPLVGRCYAMCSWMHQKEVSVIRFEDIVGENGRREFVSDQIAKITGAKSERVNDVINNRLQNNTRHTFRKGKVGGWREEIPIEFHKELNSELSDILKIWNY